MSDETGRFVILTHDHPFLHWDLMLERDGSLRTWRLLASPTADRQIAARSLPDHRLHYLEYEGAVSGDRGQVTRWDSGHYRGNLTPPQIVCEIEGNRLTGAIELTDRGDGLWEFCYRPATSGAAD